MASTGTIAAQTAWVRRALQAPPPPQGELLLLRDAAGHSLRPLSAPPGITPRTGAVLLLLYPDHPDVRLPLIVRSAQLTNHRGEVGLPGGATDPGDATPSATALREAHEEIGINPADVSIWGTLSQMYIPPSNFAVTPVVGGMGYAPDFLPNKAEVDAVLTVTLQTLLEPTTVQFTERILHGTPVSVPHFAIQGHEVWGATAIMLSELVARLRRTQHHN